METCKCIWLSTNLSLFLVPSRKDQKLSLQLPIVLDTHCDENNNLMMKYSYKHLITGGDRVEPLNLSSFILSRFCEVSYGSFWHFTLACVLLHGWPCDKFSTASNEPTDTKIHSFSMSLQCEKSLNFLWLLLCTSCNVPMRFFLAVTKKHNERMNICALHWRRKS